MGRAGRDGAARRLASQASDALYARFTGLSGWEVRGYTFDASPGFATKAGWQWHMPFVLAAPLGRSLSVDLSTHYANTRLETTGASQTVSGFTDTQVRLLYTIDRDRLVGSLCFRLPTGQHTVRTSQFEAAGAIGSNYLSFPVASFGSAFGVTGGAAYARQVGDWNVGMSGSRRYVATYSPFIGDTLSYKPGLEGRVRAGADRLLGRQSRLLLGATVSTFSTDVFTGSSALPLGLGWYSPGTRLIGELAFVHVVGRATVTFSA